ncbi:hypothetical protein TMatcc_003620 [Talaromyces marneffei ATCC 18224]
MGEKVVPSRSSMDCDDVDDMEWRSVSCFSSICESVDSDIPMASTARNNNRYKLSMPTRMAWRDE